MKNFERIGINSGKLMKNEELIHLRGGENDNCCMCYESPKGQALGIMLLATKENCNNLCQEAWNPPYEEAFGFWSCGD